MGLLAVPWSRDCPTCFYLQSTSYPWLGNYNDQVWVCYSWHVYVFLSAHTSVVDSYFNHGESSYSSLRHTCFFVQTHVASQCFPQIHQINTPKLQPQQGEVALSFGRWCSFAPSWPQSSVLRSKISEPQDMALWMGMGRCANCGMQELRDTCSQ